MLDSQQLDSSIQEIVDKLADSRLCVDYRPDELVEELFMLVEIYNKGVTNIMGRLMKAVDKSPRFNMTRRARIIVWLEEHGVGHRAPARMLTNKMYRPAV